MPKKDRKLISRNLMSTSCYFCGGEVEQDRAQVLGTPPVEMVEALDAAFHEARIRALNAESALAEARAEGARLLAVVEWYGNGNGALPAGHCGDYGVRARAALGATKRIVPGREHACIPVGTEAYTTLDEQFAACVATGEAQERARIATALDARAADPATHKTYRSLLTMLAREIREEA